MMPSSPFVSVIIPVYNGDRYLSEAIESVLQQTYQSFEVIVVDDGSTDNTATVAQQFGDTIRYLYQENGGTAAARNTGIQMAQGDFLAFLDADDLWLEHKLAVQVRAFAEQPTLDLVSGQVEQFFSPDLPPDVQATLHCPSDPIPGCIPSALLIKRQAFDRVGNFSTVWKVAEFPDWYARATETGLVTHTLADVVAKRRIHATNKGIQHKQTAQLEYVRILKAALDRKRANQSSHEPTH
ncbi:glycosyltransferase family 2 protein [Oscillatoria sp. FACHB-1407]|uniref:glycosyltransferase family 2 protein n=1 Tax=Oscillatoria sp. FACHB-1407 TaxID=2692847 RepID=UPI00168894A5|nr:glycosyltransferase family A protein [Oscillatoria sp. FACHB-1407]MBD2459423.1 glycosyltransferase family 2 protein [Oscillatoria sp. FACHB-1407]